jgi:ATP-dependent Lon protease
MQESVQAALGYIRSHTAELGIEERFFDDVDLHLHVPSGAIPKDGPSAGVTMATAIASAVSGRKVRPEVAMTGEITLTGKVLAIGGLKDKVIAAHRAGIKTIIFPKANAGELEEIPETIKKDLTFKPISRAEEAIEKMLIWT